MPSRPCRFVVNGAGGNAGAVAAGFLFRSSSLSWPTAFLILGCVVVGVSTLAWLVRFTEVDEAAVRKEIETRLKQPDAAAA